MFINYIFEFTKFPLIILGLFTLNFGLNKIINRRMPGLRLNPSTTPLISYGLTVLFALFISFKKIQISTSHSYYFMTSFLCLLGIMGIINMMLRRYQLKLFFHHNRLLIAVTGLLFLSFFYFGPFFEYPSDPLSHLNRIFSFKNAEYLDEVSYSQFNYFFSFIIFKHVTYTDSTYYLFALYAAFFQTLLFFSFYRLLKYVLHDKYFALCGSLLSLGYFGTNIFSFYNYYTFARTYLAYIVFVEAMILLVSAVHKKSFLPILGIFPLLIYCYFNHDQEALFIILQVIGAPLVILAARQDPFKSSGFIKRLSLFTLIAVAVGIAGFKLVQRFPHFTEIDYVTEVTIPLFPSFFILDLGFSKPFSMTLGIVGWSVFLLAVTLLVGVNKPTKISTILGFTIIPIFALLFPPSLSYLGKLIPSYGLYRLVYSSFFWLNIVVIFKLIAIRFNLNLKYTVYVSTLILLALSTYRHTPVYGRLTTLFYRVDDDKNGRDLTPVINVLIRHKCTQAGLSYASDAYTAVYLKLHGIKAVGTRFNTTIVNQQYKTPKHLLMKMDIGKICAIIMNKHATISWVGGSSGHWKATEASSVDKYSKSFLQAVSALEESHFIKTRINSDVTIYTYNRFRAAK